MNAEETWSILAVILIGLFGINSLGFKNLLQIEHEILEASLSFVKEHGFTQKALLEGARLRGLDNAPKEMFPEPEISLIDTFLYDADEQIQESLSKNLQFLNLSLKDKIIYACTERLKLTLPIRKHWENALAILQEDKDYGGFALFKVGEKLCELCIAEQDKSVKLFVILNKPHWMTYKSLIAAVYSSAGNAIL
ncbi:hypothetical protein ROZALSC1DRAFT_27689, partial [Rozella allomycis CSF55]